MTSPRRLLVISHPAVLPANQGVYEALGARGWKVHLLTPARWRHEYAPGLFPATYLPGLATRASPVPVLYAGAPQRHVHLARPGALLDRIEPDVAFVEQEPIALVTGQWMGALRRRRIPFLLQQDENLERDQPWIARVIRYASIRRAAGIAARSPRASELVQRAAPWLPAPVVPHAIVDWGDAAPAALIPTPGPLRVGFAGRLIEAKGIRDLLAATAAATHPVELAFYGDGPLRALCEAAGTSARPVRVVPGLDHDRMHEAYAQMDVLVLPSRTTPGWAEQFGRVLVEAASCGRPVIGSDSGEIPWVIGETGGGLVHREGDVDDLRLAIDRLAADRNLLRSLGEQGRRGARRAFSLEAVTDATEAALEAAMGGRA